MSDRPGLPHYDADLERARERMEGSDMEELTITEAPETTEPTKQQNMSHGLRQLADWYDKHPNAPFPYNFATVSVFDFDATPEEIRSIGSAKKEWDDSIFRYVVELPNASLRFIASRSKVCTAKVVGFREIPEQHIEAYTVPAKRVEIIEWECKESILAPDPQEPASITE